VPERASSCIWIVARITRLIRWNGRLRTVIKSAVHLIRHPHALLREIPRKQLPEYLQVFLQEIDENCLNVQWLIEIESNETLNVDTEPSSDVHYRPRVVTKTR